MSEVPRVAYYWGEDAFSIDQASRAYGRLVAPEGEAMDTWRVSLEDDAAEADAAGASAARRRERALAGIEEHLAMMPLFGAGTLVMVRQPGALLAEASSRERTLALVSSVPPGNALCFSDLIGSGARGPAGKGTLRDAVVAAGGRVQEFQVPPAGRLELWLRERAGQVGVDLEPAAARLLAERVGGHVREADVDRRRRTELANAELEKLALYRPEGPISAADVDALVSESIPGSTWAFLDAVGSRAAADAAGLAERLLSAGTPMPVIVSQLHRRLRELILVREHLDAGSKPAVIVKDMKLQPFRAQKLSQQAQTWTADALDAALADLLELDLRSKGIAVDGSTVQMSESIDALALQAWLARHAAAARQRVGAR